MMTMTMITTMTRWVICWSWSLALRATRPTTGPGFHLRLFQVSKLQRKILIPQKLIFSRSCLRCSQAWFSPQPKILHAYRTKICQDKVLFLDIPDVHSLFLNNNQEEASSVFSQVFRAWGVFTRGMWSLHFCLRDFNILPHRSKTFKFNQFLLQ